MTRAHNFNAGPAALPLEVLEQARDELLDYRGTGMSIMEHSHRGAAYQQVHDEARSLIKSLLGASDDYEVLFLQGGASTQFAMVPMNFLRTSADYIDTDNWSEKAMLEARVSGKIKIAASTKEGEVYTRVPSEFTFDPKADYVHITTNNTLFGTQFHTLPSVQAPLVADMSSDFMWAPMDVSRFSLIYAGAQKNLGPSGVTIVLARKDYLQTARSDVAAIFRYPTHADADAMYNTPPTFAVYMVRNVLQWTQAQGGLKAMRERNVKKAQTLYACLDAMSDFYVAPVEKASRSMMNVVWRMKDRAREPEFVKRAEAAGLIGLKGHRTTGGMRASLYNAVSQASVDALVAFMKDFAK